MNPWFLFIESLSEILYGSLLSRKFYLLFFIMCIILCYSWIKNLISSLLHAIQQSWVDERELEFISVPGFFIPCSLCCFGGHLKSLHLFWLLSEVKKVWQNCRDTCFFFLSLSFCKNIYLFLSITPPKSTEASSLSLCEREIALLCRWAGNRNQTVSLLSFFKHLLRVLEKTFDKCCGWRLSHQMIVWVSWFSFMCTNDLKIMAVECIIEIYIQSVHH